MTKEQFHNEKMYQATMGMVRRMLSEGIISEEEYHRMDKIFLEKYRPVIGTIFSHMALTSQPS